MPADPAGSPAPISAQIRAEIDALDRELAEIEMLVGQARAEAARHEQSAPRPPRSSRVPVLTPTRPPRRMATAPS